MNAPGFIERFDALAASQPHAPAIYDQGTLAATYGELRNMARSLGGRLREHGVGPEDIVALSIPKSPEWITAMLGVWYAGAAFMPLDPALPPSRREFILADSNARFILERLAGMACGAQQYFLSIPQDSTPESKTFFPCPSGNAGEPPTLHTFCDSREPDALAYAIYTSGSTGQPKGVAVTHRGLVGLLTAQIPAFELDATSCVLWYLSANFDASISDIGTAMFSGASLHVEAPGDLADPLKLAKLLAVRGITHADLPPALLGALDPTRCPPSLRTIVIGGEACAPPIVRAWAERVRVVNCYGPTEATVCTSLSVCDPDTWDRPYIGAPIPGIRYQIIDGELQISGDGVARGYLNRPDLTAARFVERDGARWFKTGDIVREHPDGRLEFVGRSDRQIKLRGRLVAPEEIEAGLLAHPGVTRAAVVPRRVGARDVLVAFVEAKTAPHVDELREHLARLVPEWMIPTRWEQLAEMPLTATGKNELAALTSRPLTSRTPPRDTSHTAEEAVLAGIWRRILGVEAVCPEDDFFELGADSFAVIELIALGEQAGLGLNPALVAAHPKLNAMARAAHAAELADVMSAAELRTAMALDAAWQARLDAASGREVPALSPPQRVFITGATGFLGKRLLAELLTRTDAHITCLTRAATPEIETQHQHRVNFVDGDLTRPQMGLDHAQWQALAHATDTIYHLAANVNLAAPFATLRAANVGGTCSVLQLMCEGRPKRLHYASTLSVFVSTDRHTGRMEEHDDLRDTAYVYGGYAQTKWAAEVLLRSAGDRAGPISIYRLGLLTGPTDTGEGPRHDMLDLFFQGTAALGAAPADALDMLAVDITPVDYAAAAIVEMSLNAATHPTTFHIANPRPATLGDLVAAMRTVGVEVEALARHEWRQRLDAMLQAAPTTAQAATLLAMCRCLDGGLESHRSMDLFAATGAVFVQDNTEAGLEGTGLRCPEPTVELLARYARWSAGILPT